MKIKVSGILIAGLTLACLLPPASPAETARSGASKIVATYDSGLAGITLGEFKVIATFNGAAYDLKARGEFSLLAGLVFKATGQSASNGTMTGERPRPARFSSTYRSSKNSEQRRMRFTSGAVTDVTIVPQKRKSPRAVPVQQEQLRDVLDPLTGTFLSVRSTAAPGSLDICNERVRVFDGTQRFDIVLSPKRTVELPRGAPRGLPQRLAVCRVRYEPVGGHRPDHPGVQYLQKEQGIEATFARVPGTTHYIPYKIVVPTSWGNGTVELTGLGVKAAKVSADAP
jgi:hypothetical protein